MASRRVEPTSEFVSTVTIEAAKYTGKKKIFRVRPRLKALQPDHYNPELISLGLFDRRDAEKTRANRFKQAMLGAFLETVNPDRNHDRPPKDLDSRLECLCMKVVNDPKAMQELYDDDQEQISPENVRSLLTLDAVCLTSTLGAMFVHSFARHFPRLRMVLSQQDATFYELFLLDALRLENQIPLQLVLNSLQILYRGTGVANLLEFEPTSMLNSICRKLILKMTLSVGFDHDQVMEFTENIQFHECAHLLECFHRVISYQEEKKSQDRALKVRSWNDGSVYGNARTRVSVPSATQLHEAGIEFKGYKDGAIFGVKFVKKLAGLKAVVYLPTLENINDDTEALWRNVVAFEQCIDDERHFLSYLDFMDDVIDTGKDVSLLRKGRNPVILQNFLGDDKAVADMFNAIQKHCYENHRHEKWLQLREDILKFYNQRYRRLLYEALTVNFGKPWVAVSVFAAGIVIVLAFLQTFYTVWPYYHPNKANSQ